jgi:histidinol-phosphate/aromatic aminotransferase/cobyric acid decarboxylase-like protein
MAEIEFSIFARQAWADYLPDEQTLRRNVQTLEHERNAAQATVKAFPAFKVARKKVNWGLCEKQEKRWN